MATSTVDITSNVLTSLTQEEQQKVYAPNQQWTDDFAVKVAVQDFGRAETYRVQNHDWRWRNAEEIYLAWVKQMYWEGTRIPRASIGVYVAFEQVESFLPKITGAIFGDNPWFEADAAFGSDQQQARDMQALVQDQLDAANFRYIFKRAMKSALIYGDGICELSWLMSQSEKNMSVPTWRPKMTNVGNGITGPRMMQTGYERVLQEKRSIVIENRPILKYRSIKDFYIDPNCESQMVDDARYVVIRTLMTVDDLKVLRGLREFTIPPDDVLNDMANQKPSTQGDADKSVVEMMRYGWWNPIIDQTVDPGGRRIEVLGYVTDDRLVWVGNRKVPFLNIKNQYGKKLFYHASYTDVPDRFYGMSICDVVEGEQRLQQSTLNARIDEMALNIHRPVIKRRGISTPAYQLRQRPGQMIEADNPKEDYVFPDPPNVLQSGYIEVQASEARVQKTTGGSDLAVLGTATPGGNSASRTATGVGVQANATAGRIQGLVEVNETIFIEPLLNDVVRLNQMFPPLEAVPLRNQRQATPEMVLNSNVKMFMRASARMKSQMALLQSFPLIIQTLFNPAFMQELAAQGMTIDANEVSRMLAESAGYRYRAQLIRPLTQQEKQQRQQPPPAELIRQQMQQQRLQAQSQINQQNIAADSQNQDADRQTDLIKALAGHAARVAAGEAKNSSDRRVNMLNALLGHGQKMAELRSRSEQGNRAESR